MRGRRNVQLPSCPFVKVDDTASVASVFTIIVPLVVVFFFSDFVFATAEAIRLMPGCAMRLDNDPACTER